MTTALRATASHMLMEARENFPWRTIAKFMLLAAFVILIFFLGVNMTQHRFFRGGRIDPHGILRP